MSHFGINVGMTRFSAHQMQSIGAYSNYGTLCWIVAFESLFQFYSHGLGQLESLIGIPANKYN